MDIKIKKEFEDPSPMNCPICGTKFPPSVIESHAEECYDRTFERKKNAQESPSVYKKPKLEPGDSPMKKFSFCFKSTSKGKETPSSLSNIITPNETDKQNDTKQKPLVTPSCSFTVRNDDNIINEDRARVSCDSPERKKLVFGNQNQTKTTVQNNKKIPLAERMRPVELGNYVGQEKVLGDGTMLRTLIETLDIPSMILWGPPGCGKTTLAHVIATACKKNRNAKFVTLSATTAGVSDVKQVITVAKTEKNIFHRTTILFMDEIHRFNKLQQDTFLPHVENGTIILIGATTENPSFSLNNALLSRCQVFVLEKLSDSEVEAILRKTFKELKIKCIDIEPCLEVINPENTYIEETAVKTLASLCDGDARAALNALQMAVQSHSISVNGESIKNSKPFVINEKIILEGFQRSHLLYDKAGEEHYNCISALHKSLRGSDANASLYWLARMLIGGEDPLYIARRMIRFASEDIGLADPYALQQAVNTYQACQFIGLPECKVNLAQCAVYLAKSPKSISIYQAYLNAEKCIQNHKGPMPGVPLHLRNAPTKLMKDLGYGKEYKYNPSYDYKIKQKYFPDEMEEVNFFPTKTH